jgi:nucleotide-binding universal stress UspA family protein
MFKHILIATDGSELARKASDAGLELARSLGARVTVVKVTEPLDPVVIAAAMERGVSNMEAVYAEQAAAKAEQMLRAMSAAAQAKGVDCDTVHVTDKTPAEGIVDTAKQRGCDLIVMASHGRRGLSRLLLGSQASKVVTLSPVPVLIHR